ncbi:MAG TPA: rhomboid-like protein [Gaiellaceae bacterium]
MRLPWRLLVGARIHGTLCYLGLLAVATGFLAAASSSRRQALLEGSSTNLEQLAHAPVRVLIASAFWIEPASFPLWAAVLLVVLGSLERRIGTKRLLTVFSAGHVGATLLSAMGIWAGIELGTLQDSVARSRDVGVSYGLASTAAFLAGTLPLRLRLVCAGGLVTFVGSAAIQSRTFTDFGHGFALAIGFALLLGGFARGALGGFARGALVGSAGQAANDVRRGHRGAVLLAAAVIVAAPLALVERAPGGLGGRATPSALPRRIPSAAVPVRELHSSSARPTAVAASS